jgi:hypothetical protein
MSGEDNFVFVGLIGLFLRGFFSFLSLHVFFDLLFLWVLFRYAQARSEPNLRVVDDDGGIFMKVFRRLLNFSELF